MLKDIPDACKISCRYCADPFSIKTRFMAKIKGNVFMQGVTGMIGKQVVYKNRNAKQYTSAAPTIDKNRKPTPGQQLNQERMSKCSKYGKAALKNKKLRNAYQEAAKPHQSAYNVAWKDAWHPPRIVSIVTSGYKGRPGDILFVHATDNFKVVSVKILIYNNDVLVEEGEAVATGDSLMWTYTALSSVNDLPDLKIIAKAYDLPGNEAVMEVITS